MAGFEEFNAQRLAGLVNSKSIVVECPLLTRDGDCKRTGKRAFCTKCDKPPTEIDQFARQTLQGIARRNNGNKQ